MQATRKTNIKGDWRSKNEKRNVALATKFKKNMAMKNGKRVHQPVAIVGSTVVKSRIFRRIRGEKCQKDWSISPSSRHIQRLGVRKVS